MFQPDLSTFLQRSFDSSLSLPGHLQRNTLVRCHHTWSYERETEREDGMFDVGALELLELTRSVHYAEYGPVAIMVSGR